MDALEKVQKFFTCLIQSIRNLNYSERLRRLRLTLVQRHMTGTEYCTAGRYSWVWFLTLDSK